MKKLVFTIQMIALIAMFPVYMVVELSQEKIITPANKQASVIEVAAGNDKIQTTSVNVDGQLYFLMLKQFLS